MRSSFTAVGIQATTGGPSSRIAIYNSGDISAGVARPTRLPTAHRALLCARQRHRHHQQGRHKCRHLRDNRVQSLDCIGSSSTALARDVRCELHPKRQSADVRRPRQSRDAHPLPLPENHRGPRRKPPCSNALCLPENAVEIRIRGVVAAVLVGGAVIGRGLRGAGA
jgi:hypothetical protein